MFCFQKGSWHDLNPGKPGKVKGDAITEPDETDNHVDASTPVEYQLANDVRDQYE